MYLLKSSLKPPSFLLTSRTALWSLRPDLMGAIILIGGDINTEIAHAVDRPVAQKEGSNRPRSG